MTPTGYDGGFWQLRDGGARLPKDRIPHPTVCASFNDPALREDDPLRALLQDVCVQTCGLNCVEQFCVWVEGRGCLYGDE